MDFRNFFNNSFSLMKMLMLFMSRRLAMKTIIKTKLQKYYSLNTTVSEIYGSAAPSWKKWKAEP